MTTTNIDLPGDLLAFAEAEAERLKCTRDEYLSWLLSDAREHRASDAHRLRALYLDLIDYEMAQGGASTKSIDDVIAEGQARHRRRTRRHAG